MSLVFTLTQESLIQLSLGPPPAAAGGGAGSGLLGWLTAKLTEVQSMFRLVSVVGGMGFVIWQAIASRGAMARIIISGLAAALFVWIVWNVTNLQERVDQEVNAATSTPSHLVVRPAGVGLTSEWSVSDLLPSSTGVRSTGQEGS